MPDKAWLPVPFRLTDRDVRIVYLPPLTVASVHRVGRDECGNSAEYTAAAMLDEFIQKADLKTIYPAARSFGFNNPDGVPDDDPAHGYECWISIPDELVVPSPFVKRKLNGGVYAAHAIAEGAWDEGWLPLHRWVSENECLDFRWGTVDGVCGWLEEKLNYRDWNRSRIKQLDLLMPVKLIDSTRE